jgi:hypothetical protein
MKIPTKPGRRTLLKLSALGFLPATIAAQPRRSPEEEEDDDTRYRLRLVGRSGSESSLDSPLIREVADVIEPALSTPKDEASRIALVRDTLKAAFQSGMTESGPTPEYVWVWYHGQWVRVCLDMLLFQVSFGRDGTVELAVAVDEML